MKPRLNSADISLSAFRYFIPSEVMIISIENINDDMKERNQDKRPEVVRQDMTKDGQKGSHGYSRLRVHSPIAPISGNRQIYLD